MLSYFKQRYLKVIWTSVCLIGLTSPLLFEYVLLFSPGTTDTFPATQVPCSYVNLAGFIWSECQSLKSLWCLEGNFPDLYTIVTWVFHCHSLKVSRQKALCYLFDPKSSCFFLFLTSCSTEALCIILLFSWCLIQIYLIVYCLSPHPQTVKLILLTAIAEVSTSS